MKRSWLTGLIGGALFLILLVGGLVIAFVTFIAAVKKVPPENTQIVLYNDAAQRLRIDAVYYGTKLITESEGIVLDVYRDEGYRYSASLFIMVQEINPTLTIYYSGLTTGDRWTTAGEIRRMPKQPCKFVAFLREGDGTISSCRYNELQDFDGD